MHKIKYIDHNNNIYTIEAPSIHYAPMKAEFSSSGLYSGGEESFVSISPEIYEAIVEKVNVIIENKSLHLESRRMLTAMLIIHKGGETTTYIFPRSGEQSALEELLKESLQAGQ